MKGTIDLPKNENYWLLLATLTNKVAPPEFCKGMDRLLGNKKVDFSQYAIKGDYFVPVKKIDGVGIDFQITKDGYPKVIMKDGNKSRPKVLRAYEFFVSREPEASSLEEVEKVTFAWKSNKTNKRYIAVVEVV